VSESVAEVAPERAVGRKSLGVSPRTRRGGLCGAVFGGSRQEEKCNPEKQMGHTPGGHRKKGTAAGRQFGEENRVQRPKNTQIVLGAINQGEHNIKWVKGEGGYLSRKGALVGQSPYSQEPGRLKVMRVGIKIPIGGEVPQRDGLVLGALSKCPRVRLRGSRGGSKIKKKEKQRPSLLIRPIDRALKGGGIKKKKWREGNKNVQGTLIPVDGVHNKRTKNLGAI